MKICVEYLTSQLNTDNVLHIFERSRLYAPASVVAAAAAAAAMADHAPSAPPMDSSHNGGGEDGGEGQQSFWCGYLLERCLDFVDDNASAVLASEVGNLANFTLE